MFLICMNLTQKSRPSILKSAHPQTCKGRKSRLKISCGAGALRTFWQNLISNRIDWAHVSFDPRMPEWGHSGFQTTTHTPYITFFTINSVSQIISRWDSSASLEWNLASRLSGRWTRTLRRMWIMRTSPPTMWPTWSSSSSEIFPSRSSPASWEKLSSIFTSVREWTYISL